MIIGCFPAPENSTTSITHGILFVHHVFADSLVKDFCVWAGLRICCISKSRTYSKSRGRTSSRGTWNHDRRAERWYVVVQDIVFRQHGVRVCSGTTPELFPTSVANDGVLHLIQYSIRCFQVETGLKFRAGSRSTVRLGSKSKPVHMTI